MGIANTSLKEHFLRFNQYLPVGTKSSLTDYDGIIREWKYITRKLNADIVVLENETLFDSRKFRGMGDLGKLMEDQFLSLLSYVAEQERKKNRQRQAEGIEVAKNKGVKFVRRKYKINADFIQVYDEWKSGFITSTGGPNTFYRRFIVFAGLQSIRLCRPISTTTLCGNNSKRILNFPDKNGINSTQFF
ncbi:recombinase family protein [Peribacillus frigoritolerans]|uniref:recombinase family protein n=1 Tax=Peribacillus frigoritolerans TaxID=450367 RepID=UPI000B0771E7